MIYEFRLIDTLKNGNELCGASLKYGYVLPTIGVIQYGYVFRFLTHTSVHFHIGALPGSDLLFYQGFRIKLNPCQVVVGRNIEPLSF